MERILDVAFKNLYEPTCTIMHCGPPHERITIAPTSLDYDKYVKGGKVLRWYVGLMGETSPELSPLSVDVAGDKEYHVYRYDWVFGVTCADVSESKAKRGQLWWDWQKALRKGTSAVVQLIILPGTSGLAYTCVATNLNVLPPARDTETWWYKNRGGVLDLVKEGTKAAEDLYPGAITKAFSALTNSLNARDRWKRTNWFIYQYLDSETQGCAVEWQINKKIMKQYGPLLRGSLVLAFHGGTGDGSTERQRHIRMIMRPQLGFHPKKELVRLTPQMKEPDQVALDIVPRSAPHQPPLQARDRVEP